MGDAGGGYRRSVTPLTAALTCTCPSCGKGPLFDGFLSVADRCPACGFDLGKADSGDGPAVFIIFILGALVVPAALLLEAYAAPPYWVHIALWPLVILAGSIALLRPLKALLIALQFKHRASDSGSQHYD
jgi:uncharacterized protein (DUF983 family)